MMRPSLRLPAHRGTTAHVASLYPFAVRTAPRHRGPYVGVDLLTGGAEFCWDPFEAYADGQVTNPNVWLLGEPGNGKSALVKCLLLRMTAVYGPARWYAVIDPKGEYAPLADRLGLATLRLEPGGTVRLNPLADSPGAAHEPADRRMLRRATMLTALVGTVLDRPLTQLEDAALFAAVEILAAPSLAEPTLADVAALLATPTEGMAARLHRQLDGLAADLAPVGYAVDKLLTRSLRGMFDGPSTVTVPADGPGLLLDLSAIPLHSEAMPLVMVAAAGWLAQILAVPGRQRVQVVDEAWALLGNRHTAGYLQHAFKLGRAYGVANLCIAHRPSDLAAQADDGTATAKIAAGLLADAATKTVLRQAPDQLDLATQTLGLTEPEQAVVTRLARGRALWKTGSDVALVQHLLSDAETVLCDTDARMITPDVA